MDSENCRLRKQLSKPNYCEENDKENIENHIMQISSGFKEESRRQINNRQWNMRESMEYLKFVCKNKRLLFDQRLRRKRKIFQKMSEYVGTRNSTQCRSHHQKQLSKFNNTRDFLMACLESIEKRVFFLKTEKFKTMSNSG